MKSGLMLAASLLVTGCSGYSITKLDENEKDTDEKGYIVYAPKPVLLQTCSIDDKGGVKYTSEVKYLPDYKKPFRIKNINRLCASKTEFSFENGWMLTSVNSDYTSPETLLGKVVDAAGSVAKPSSTGSVTCQNRICDISSYGSSGSVSCKNIGELTKSFGSGAITE